MNKIKLIHFLQRFEAKVDRIYSWARADSDEEHTAVIARNISHWLAESIDEETELFKNDIPKIQTT